MFVKKEPFFVATRGKCAKLLYHIYMYSSIIQHLKTAVAKKICGRKKLFRRSFVFKMTATVIPFAKMILKSEKNDMKI